MIDQQINQFENDEIKIVAIVRKSAIINQRNYVEYKIDIKHPFKVKNSYVEVQGDCLHRDPSDPYLLKFHGHGIKINSKRLFDFPNKKRNLIRDACTKYTNTNEVKQFVSDTETKLHDWHQEIETQKEIEKQNSPRWQIDNGKAKLIATLDPIKESKWTGTKVFKLNDGTYWLYFTDINGDYYGQPQQITESDVPKYGNIL